MSGKPASTELRAAWLTPPGPGGVALLGIRGPDLGAWIAPYWRSRGRAVPFETGRLIWGQLEQDAAVLDEVVVAVKGPQDFEVGFHGGDATRQAIDHWLEQAGVRVESGMGFVAGSDRVRQEALEGLGRARGMRALEVLLRAESGELAARIASLSEALRTGSEGAGAALRALAEEARCGCALLDPPRILLLGPPNAGKSSLGNALLREDRFIVAEQLGTTRDLIRAPLEIQGFPFELVDGAGLRSTDDEVERMGASRVRAAAQEARTIGLAVLPGDDPDAGTGPIWEEIRSRCNLTVMTKGDRIGSEGQGAQARGAVDSFIATSAQSGQGLDALRSALLAASPFARFPASERRLPFTARQAASIAAATAAADPAIAAASLLTMLEESA